MHSIFTSATIKKPINNITSNIKELTGYNSGDFIFVNFTNKKENGIDAIYGSNEWFALTTEESGEPYYFQYRDLSDSNKNYILLFITKKKNDGDTENEKCYLHSSVLIDSIDSFN